MARIAVNDSHVAVAKLQALQIGRKTPETAGIAIDGGERDVGKLEQVRRLSARSGAGIQHAHALRDVEERCRELCPEVLHRERAFGVARKLDDGPWPTKQHSP